MASHADGSGLALVLDPALEPRDDRPARIVIPRGTMLDVRRRGSQPVPATVNGVAIPTVWLNSSASFRLLSRQHAHLRCRRRGTGDVLIMYDGSPHEQKRSCHGSSVDGVRVPPSGHVVVEEGSVIVFGAPQVSSSMPPADVLAAEAFRYRVERAANASTSGSPAASERPHPPPAPPPAAAPPSALQTSARQPTSGPSNEPHASTWSSSDIASLDPTRATVADGSAAAARGEAGTASTGKGKSPIAAPPRLSVTPTTWRPCEDGGQGGRAEGGPHSARPCGDAHRKGGADEPELRSSQARRDAAPSNLSDLPSTLPLRMGPPLPPVLPWPRRSSSLLVPLRTTLSRHADDERTLGGSSGGDREQCPTTILNFAHGCVRAASELAGETGDDDDDDDDDDDSLSGAPPPSAAASRCLLLATSLLRRQYAPPPALLIAGLTGLLDAPSAASALQVAAQLRAHSAACGSLSLIDTSAARGLLSALLQAAHSIATAPVSPVRVSQCGGNGGKSGHDGEDEAGEDAMQENGFDGTGGCLDDAASARASLTVQLLCEAVGPGLCPALLAERHGDAPRAATAADDDPAATAAAAASTATADLLCAATTLFDPAPCHASSALIGAMLHAGRRLAARVLACTHHSSTAFALATIEHIGRWATLTPGGLAPAASPGGRGLGSGSHSCHAVGCRGERSGSARACAHGGCLLRYERLLCALEEGCEQVADAGVRATAREQASTLRASSLRVLPADQPTALPTQPAPLPSQQPQQRAAPADASPAADGLLRALLLRSLPAPRFAPPPSLEATRACRGVAALGIAFDAPLDDETLALLWQRPQSSETAGSGSEEGWALTVLISAFVVRRLLRCGLLENPPSLHATCAAVSDLRRRLARHRRSQSGAAAMGADLLQVASQAESQLEASQGGGSSPTLMSQGSTTTSAHLPLPTASCAWPAVASGFLRTFSAITAASLTKPAAETSRPMDVDALSHAQSASPHRVTSNSTSKRPRRDEGAPGVVVVD